MTDKPQVDGMSVLRTARSISRIVIGAILIGSACAVVGLLVGATIGGNLAGASSLLAIADTKPLA